MAKLKHYKSKSAYMRANAYRHIHGIKGKARKVVIAGKVHKVKRTRKSR